LCGVALLLAFAMQFVQAETSAKDSADPRKSVAKKAAFKRVSSKGKKSRRVANWRKHGQQKIDSKRALEIQEALIREHYLSGEATGAWNDESQKAMERFQADNWWQSKVVPDSRALIKLGLGPDHDHLLNPESAMTSQPISPRHQSASGTAVVAPTPNIQPQN
jgi:hypothetical protein